MSADIFDKTFIQKFGQAIAAELLSGNTSATFPTGDYLDKNLLFKLAGSVRAAVNAAGGMGNKFTSGISVPSNSAGTNGDWYLRTSDKSLYQKSSGTWTMMGVLASAVTNTAAQFICPDAVTRDSVLAS
jgi:hypothetical protein